MSTASPHELALRSPSTATATDAATAASDISFDREALGHAVSLASLAPGHAAVVASIDPGSPAARRLLDLGFVPGSEVTVVRRAPLGDPTEYLVRGSHLALRRAQAAGIRVWPHLR